MAASEPPSILLLLDPIAPLQDDDDANELDKFSDHASSKLEESSPQATINNNEERGNKNRFINTSLTVSPFVNILSALPKINIFMQQIVKNLIIFQYFYKILHQIFLYATLVAYTTNSTLNNPMNFQIQHVPFTFYKSTDISISQKRVY